MVICYLFINFILLHHILIKFFYHFLTFLIQKLFFHQRTQMLIEVCQAYFLMFQKKQPDPINQFLILEVHLIMKINLKNSALQSFDSFKAHPLQKLNQIIHVFHQFRQSIPTRNLLYICISHWPSFGATRGTIIRIVPFLYFMYFVHIWLVFLFSVPPVKRLYVFF